MLKINDPLTSAIPLDSGLLSINDIIKKLTTEKLSDEEIGECIYLSADKIRELKQKMIYKDRGKIKNKQTSKIYRKTIMGRYVDYKKSAKIKKRVFNITLTEFEKLVNNKCYYCGENGYGVDRVDNNLGYIFSNVVSCCTMCNRMKMAHTQNDFINQCKKIVNNIIK